MPSTTLSRRGAYLLIGSVVLTGSVSFSLIKIALRQLSPMSLAAGRVGFSALAFTIVVALRPSIRQPLIRRDRWRVVACGVIGSIGFHLPFTWGQSRVSVAVATVVVATMPAIAAAGEAVFLRTRVLRSQIIGLVLSLAGVVVIANGAEGGFSVESVAGLLALFAAAIAWAAVTVLTKSIADRYDGTWINWPGTVIGAIAMMAIASPTLGEYADLTIVGWLVVFWLGAMSSAFIYYALSSAMRVLSATVTASSTALVTPLSILAAWPLLGDTPTLVVVVGCALVVVGVLLVTIPGTARPVAQ